MTTTKSRSPVQSPLRYPGSKRRLAQYIRQTLKCNNLQPALYVEPFAGGASVGLQLLQYNLVEKAIFMELDPWVASFWRTVFFDADWLIEKIKTANITLDSWDEIKGGRPRSIREQAWACFYLNRTSFSGILEENAGPLGGRAQQSDYKIDCRFPRETLIKRISQAAAFKDRVHSVWHCSWEDGLTRIKTEQKNGTLPKKNIFYYLDPPFFEKAEALYRFHFQKTDHTRLRDFLLRFKDSWLLSYDSSDQVEALYGSVVKPGTNGTNRHHVDIYYSLAVLSERRIAKEVILSNLPNLPSQTEESYAKY